MNHTVTQIEKVFYSRSKADAAGAKRYFGMVCKKHPELNGERSARNAVCIGCNRDKMRQRRANNPEYHRRATRLAYEKWYQINREKVLAKGREKRTGMNSETYRRLLEFQGGECALCGDSLNEKRAHADHCHDTKKPRGVLCGPCNQVEGLIRRTGFDPEEFGKRLADYLKHPPSEKIETN